MPKKEDNKVVVVRISESHKEALMQNIQGLRRLPSNVSVSSTSPMNVSSYTIRIFTPEEQVDLEKKINEAEKAGWLSPSNDEIWKKDSRFRAHLVGSRRDFHMNEPFDVIHLRILEKLGLVGAEGSGCHYERFDSDAEIKLDENKTLRLYTNIRASFDKYPTLGERIGFMLVVTGKPVIDIKENVTSDEVSSLLDSALVRASIVNEKNVKLITSRLEVLAPTLHSYIITCAAIYNGTISFDPNKLKGKYTIGTMKINDLPTLVAYVEKNKTDDTETYRDLVSEVKAIR